MLNRISNPGRVLLLGVLMAALSTEAPLAQQAAVPTESAAEALPKAPCMERQNSDRTTARVRVPTDEAAAYEALGYRAIACDPDDLPGLQLGAVCRFAAVAPPESGPYLTEYYGVTIEQLCASARRAGAALGVDLDEADHRPDWARRQDTARGAAVGSDR